MLGIPGSLADQPIPQGTLADLPHHEKIDLPRLSKPYHQTQLQAEINRLLADQQCPLE